MGGVKVLLRATGGTSTIRTIDSVENGLSSALGLPARLSLPPAPALVLLESLDVAFGGSVVGDLREELL